MKRKSSKYSSSRRTLSSVNTSYGPEDATTFEIGYKTRALDITLTLAANLYHTIYDGKQFTGNVPYDVVATTEYDIDTEFSGTRRTGGNLWERKTLVNKR